LACNKSRSIAAFDIDLCKDIPYKQTMIASFRSKPLKRYWIKGDDAGIRPDWRSKVRLILSRLDVATTPAAMNSPGLGFHALTGDL
jgi:proteic killer suppression protein